MRRLARLLQCVGLTLCLLACAALVVTMIRGERGSWWRTELHDDPEIGFVPQRWFVSFGGGRAMVGRERVKRNDLRALWRLQGEHEGLLLAIDKIQEGPGPNELLSKVVAELGREVEKVSEAGPQVQRLTQRGTHLQADDLAANPLMGRSGPETAKWKALGAAHFRSGDGSYWRIDVPAWALLAALCVWPVMAAARLWRRHRWKLNGQCVTCGYDQRATPGACPECGASSAA
jgi:hypothetical protein